MLSLHVYSEETFTIGLKIGNGMGHLSKPNQAFNKLNK